ncbi:MAG: glycosyltransferase [Gammaproteobacteria bacterium]
MIANPDNALTVSVVIYDSEQLELQAMLESLLTALMRLPVVGLHFAAHVSLVDNSETHLLRTMTFSDLESRFLARGATLNVVSGHGNVGYGRGHNLVIRSSADKYHLVLNPDVELAPDSLAIGLLYLEKHPDVAVVSPYAETSDGDKQHLCKRHPSVLTLFMRGFFPDWIKRLFYKRLAHYEMHDLPEDQPSDRVPLISGCCMLCRAGVLRAIEGFDENYFLYFEDFDLSLRLGARARVVYLPGMKIRHFGGNAAGKGLKHIALYTRSAWRFFNTWGWRFIQ